MRGERGRRASVRTTASAQARASVRVFAPAHVALTRSRATHACTWPDVRTLARTFRTLPLCAPVVKRGDEQTRLYAGVRVCVSLAPAGAVAQRLVALALTPGEADTEVDEPMADVSDSAAPGAAEAAADDAFGTDARAFFAGAHALVAFDAADCSGGSALAAAAEAAVARALREADGDVREVDCDARALAEQREVVEYAWDAACGAGDPRVGCASLAAAERALATLGGAGTGAGAAPGAQPPLHARAARVAAALEAAAAEAELEEAATAARDSVQLAEAAKAIADVRQVRAEEQKRGAVAIGGSALPKAEGAVHAAVLAAGSAGRDHAKAVERLVVAEVGDATRHARAREDTHTLTHTCAHGGVRTDSLSHAPAYTRALARRCACMRPARQRPARRRATHRRPTLRRRSPLRNGASAPARHCSHPWRHCAVRSRRALRWARSRQRGSAPRRRRSRPRAWARRGAGRSTSMGSTTRQRSHAINEMLRQRVRLL